MSDPKVYICHIGEYENLDAYMDEVLAFRSQEDFFNNTFKSWVSFSHLSIITMCDDYYFIEMLDWSPRKFGVVHEDCVEWLKTQLEESDETTSNKRIKQ